MDIARKTVVYEIPGMQDVTVRRDVPYHGELKLDAYYPRGAGDDERRTGDVIPSLPAVILAAGFPDRGMQSRMGCGFRDMGWTVSWARLIAASGMAAITYTAHEPVADAAALLQHLRDNAATLNIDTNRLGVLASSGHGPLALSLLPNGIRCAALLYPYTLDLDGTAVADNAKVFGYANPGADLPAGVPLFLARAGADQVPRLNETLDRFIAECLRRNVDLTFVNHAAGAHAFDLMEDSDATREVVKRVLRFLRYQLGVRSKH
jgi:dienelactone hydrolase